MFQLPAGARLWHELDHDAAWSQETHVLASIADDVAAANWQRSGGKGKRPEPIERPSDRADKRRKAQRVIRNAERFRRRHHQ